MTLTRDRNRVGTCAAPVPRVIACSTAILYLAHSGGTRTSKYLQIEQFPTPTQPAGRATRRVPAAALATAFSEAVIM
ncbi:MAG: hypothetical protein ACREE4_19920, partial [Stellaceae bacterium]